MVKILCLAICLKFLLVIQIMISFLNFQIMIFILDFQIMIFVNLVFAGQVILKKIFNSKEGNQNFVDFSQIKSLIMYFQII